MSSLSLYEQDDVISEWEDFLEGIASSPRPPAVERHTLAVDASDFTRKPEWRNHPKSPNDNVDAIDASDLKRKAQWWSHPKGRSHNVNVAEAQGDSKTASSRKRAQEDRKTARNDGIAKAQDSTRKTKPVNRADGHRKSGRNDNNVAAQDDNESVRKENIVEAQEKPKTTSYFQTSRGGDAGDSSDRNDTCPTHTIQSTSAADGRRSQGGTDGPQHAPGAATRNEATSVDLDGAIDTVDEGVDKDKFLQMGEHAGVGSEIGCADVATRRGDRIEEPPHGTSMPSESSLDQSSVFHQARDAEDGRVEPSHGTSTPLVPLDRSSTLHQSGDAEDRQEEPHSASTLLASSLGVSSAIRQSGDVEVADDLAEDSTPELLYAIEFSVASPHKDTKTVQLLAEVSDSRRFIHLYGTTAMYQYDGP